MVCSQERLGPPGTRPAMVRQLLRAC